MTTRAATASTETAQAWPAAVREVLGADLVAAFATTTPMGGVSLVPVCPLGMYDEGAGTVTITSPVCMSKKLARLQADSRCALAFFSRAHGASSDPRFIVVQGRAELTDRPTPEFTEEMLSVWPHFLLPPPTSRLGKWAGREYYEYRVPVRVHVERILVWDDLAATGGPMVIGEPAPTRLPEPQPAPAKGTAPRIAARNYQRQLGRSVDQLLGYVDATGYPLVIPVSASAGESGIRLDRDDIPADGRRAGFLGFWCNAKLAGQGALLANGWLDCDPDGVATFAPHTSSQFNLPSAKVFPKVIVPLAVKAQYRAARRKGLVDGNRWLLGPRT